jgi:hypothetical protein
LTAVSLFYHDQSFKQLLTPGIVLILLGSIFIIGSIIFYFRNYKTSTETKPLLGERKDLLQQLTDQEATTPAFYLSTAPTPYISRESSL